jgi:chemotaxis protein CheD
VEEARQRIRGTEAVAKFADESVGRLVAEIEKIGGEKGRFKAKLVGGAKLFRMLSGDDKGVGFRNAEAARNALLRLAIPIEAEDVGGAVGRSATFTIENGLVEITTVI